MGGFDRLRLLVLKSGIQGRVRTFWQSLGQRIRSKKTFSDAFLVVLSRQREKIFGGVGILISMGLGIWANQSSEEAAIRRWERTFIPSKQVFKFAMQGYGFKELQETRTLQKLALHFPEAVDELASIWVDPHARWVVFSEKEDGFSQPQVYCTDCKLLPESWQRIGVGWRGLEVLISNLNGRTSDHFENPGKKKSLEWKDPRAISY